MPEVAPHSVRFGKIQRKDEVLAELMAEHVALKKEIGETLTGKRTIVWDACHDRMFYVKLTGS